MTVVQKLIEQKEKQHLEKIKNELKEVKKQVEIRAIASKSLSLRHVGKVTEKLTKLISGSKSGAIHNPDQQLMEIKESIEKTVNQLLDIYNGNTEDRALYASIIYRFPLRKNSKWLGLHLDARKA